MANKRPLDTDVLGITGISAWQGYFEIVIGCVHVEPYPGRR